MRILYISTVDISKPDGPGVNEYEFVNALKKQLGQNVSFIIPKPVNPIDIESENIIYLKGSVGSEPRLMQQLQLVLIARRVCRESKYDLIVARLSLLPFDIWAITKLVNVPLAIKTLGEPTLKYLRSSGGVKSYIAKILRYPNQFLLKSVVTSSIGADACTRQLTERNMKYLKIQKEGKIIHIENATNTSNFFPTLDSVAKQHLKFEKFKYIVGYVGGKPWERGGKELIEVLPILQERYPTLGVVIVGGGEGVVKLKELSKSLNVEKNCIIPGEVPYKDVPKWINSFDIGVAFDLVDRMSYVGSSNQKIRQYIACGKPVIATPGGNHFIEDENLGTIVEHNNLTKFAEAIEHWLSLLDSEKAKHTKKAHSYAKEKLSTDYALKERLVFWQKRISDASG